MKILQIHNYYQVPGGECAVVGAERELLESDGHTVCQFTRESADINRYDAAGKIKMLVRIPWNRVAAESLTRTIRRFRPDVAHIHNLYPLLSPSVFDALERERVPAVQTHHNFRFFCPNGLFFINGRICDACTKSYFACVRHRCIKDNHLLSALYALAVYQGWRRGVFAGKIARHIALNPFFAERLARSGIPNSTIRICGNYITAFAERDSEKEDYFLYLGRLSPEKGLFTLLESAKTVAAKVKIAGTGPLEQEMRRFIRIHQLRNVEVLGYVEGERKSELLRRCIALVVPSECYENFPISVVEAQAEGTAVLASRIGGLPTVVSDEETGYLFEPGNAEELARLMNKMAERPDLVETLSCQSLERAKALFTPESHLEQLLQIYAEAVQAV